MKILDIGDQLVLVISLQVALSFNGVILEKSKTAFNTDHWFWWVEAMVPSRYILTPKFIKY